MIQILEIKKFVWQIIINPNALSGNCIFFWKDIIGHLEASAVSYDSHFATQTGEGIEIASTLYQKNHRHFIVLGGDGTINEVVNGLMRHEQEEGEQVYVVPFPVGTGNDWSRTHNYPTDYRKVFDIFLNGRFQRHDVGVVKSLNEQGEELQSRFFVNIAGFGFDAAIIYKMTRKNIRHFKTMQYLLTLLQILFSYKAVHGTIFLDEQEEITDHIFSIAVGICKYNGNGMKQVPMAKPDDGKFDVIVIRKISPWKVLFNVLRIFSGKHLTLREISIHSCEKLTIRTVSPLLGEVEGELLQTGNYEISNHKSIDLMMLI
jgi:YegS/Rv2252/BmrU family lipid kinase